MAFRLPHRSIHGEFARFDAKASRVGSQVERNFDEIEREVARFGPYVHLFVDPPRFEVQLNGAQTYTAASFDRTLYDDEVYDSHEAFDLSTSQYTIPVSGLWVFKSMNHLTTAANEGIAPSLWANGGEARRGNDYTSSYGVPAGGVSCEVQLSAGDVVEQRVYLRAAANRGKVGSGVQNFFTGRWVAPLVP